VTLDKAVASGDVERVHELVCSMTEKERRAAARTLPLRSMWQANPRVAVAYGLAQLGTSTARQVGSSWFLIRPSNGLGDFVDLAVGVFAARGKAFSETVVRGFFRQDFFFDWTIVRRLVRDGIIDPPDDDAYVVAMVHGVHVATSTDPLESALLALREDPGLLEDEVWRLFTVDVGSAIGPGVWEPNPDGQGIRRGATNRWTYALVELSRTGELDRDRLLDASLDALARDFRPSGLGWYASLHEALAPTAPERLARLDAYLAIAGSPAPTAMKAGLAALRALGDAVPPDALAGIAPAALTQKQKNLALEMLALLDAATKREGEHRDVVLEAMVHALGHERADVQERTLKLLEGHADAVPRATLLGYVDTVSPTLRERVGALVGVEAPQPLVVEERRPSPEPAAPPAPLVPVESLDELIELTAALLEGQGGGDDAERFLDGVSRLCDQRPRGFEARTAGLLKRAEAPQEWLPGGTGRGLVAFVVQAWLARRRFATPQTPDTLLGFLTHRSFEVARRASRGITRQLLAFPTHEGGWIDPDQLAEREKRAGRVLNRPDPFDRTQARLRALAPGAPIEFDHRVVTRPMYGTPVRRLLLQPPALPVELEPLARIAITHENAGVPAWWGVTCCWASWDMLGGRWSLTVAPAHPEIAFSGAATAAAQAVELSPQLCPEPALEHALDPRVRLGREAWLLVALALVAKSADLRRLGTDVVVATVDDGRLDADALGAALAWLADACFVKATRLEQPLRDAGRVSPRHAERTLRVLEAFVDGCAETPHGLHAPLGVVLEHAVAARLAVSRREAFERIAAGTTASSKLGKLTRALLELQAA
jgi:Family of unknown function (DUF6493)